MRENEGFSTALPHNTIKIQSKITFNRAQNVVPSSMSILEGHPIALSTAIVCSSCRSRGGITRKSNSATASRTARTGTAGVTFSCAAGDEDKLWKEPTRTAPRNALDVCLPMPSSGAIAACPALRNPPPTAAITCLSPLALNGEFGIAKPTRIHNVMFCNRASCARRASKWRHPDGECCDRRRELFLSL